MTYFPRWQSSVRQCLGWLALSVAVCSQAAPAIETLTLTSRDGVTRLTGYLWKPAGDGPFPAIVMLHGRAGSYSVAARGVYDASTLTRRHRAWGEFWAARGYLALHVDSFGPRGYPQGFARNTYQDRPAAVSEHTVRPLDAYAALHYLRDRSDVLGDRIGVQGWSNGAMTVLAALGGDPRTGFRAALAFYPGCGEQDKRDYMPYAPLLMLLAAEDDEVSPAVCRRVGERAIARGANLELVVYPGAEHAFDDPGSRKQANEANRTATADAQQRAAEFLARHMR